MGSSWTQGDLEIIQRLWAHFSTPNTNGTGELVFLKQDSQEMIRLLGTVRFRTIQEVTIGLHTIL